MSGLKKKLTVSTDLKRSLIEPEHQQLSIRRQCELIGLNRSSFYYELAGETDENLLLMQLIDEEYTRHPFKGSRKLTQWLIKEGQSVNRKRVQRLMRIMGIEAIYPKPRTTQANKEHKVYPYLLRNLPITRPDQVWSADITYIRLQGGFMYLTAVMDWYSRYVLSWRLSNTLDSSFCVEALEDALSASKPEIFNTDQGVQYTSSSFTDRLEAQEIAISMDGKGRALDNVFIERLWRTLKYEDIYIRDYQTVQELIEGLRRYFAFYNNERHHQSLDNQTPAEIYGGRMPARPIMIGDGHVEEPSYPHFHDTTIIA